MNTLIREEGKHGGSAIYIKDSIVCREYKNTNKLSILGEFECCAVECSLKKINIIVLCIYRPPGGSIEVFFNQLENILSNQINLESTIFITGDFNIEMLDENRNKLRLATMLNFYSIRTTVVNYTRVTEQTKSCLDNICTNLHNGHTSVILASHVSDHFGQKFVFNIDKNDERKFVRKRFLFDEANRINFVDQLKQQTWEDILVIDRKDVNEQWKTFINVYLNIFNQSFPLTRIHSNNNKKYKKSERAEEIKHQLDILLVLLTDNPSLKEQYKNMKKYYDSILKEDKKKYLQDRIMKSDCKMRSMWTICGELTGKNKHRENNIDENPKSLPDKFNIHLIEAVQKLVDEVHHQNFFCDIEENDQSLFLRPVNTGELVNLCSRLKNKHSSGYDDIPTSIVKLSLVQIASVLCYIINNSMKFGKFPDQLKFALIKPIYKKGDRNSLDSYRPISLLPSFSKIFELVMCTRLLDFFKKCNLFLDSQHGFLKGKSTNTAIYHFVNMILQEFEKKNLAIGVFLDLSKAYDCVNLEYLLIKLEKYGIRGKAYKWIESYLLDRKQQVIINENKSNIAIKERGLAQGSNAGPIFFIIYINDLIMDGLVNYVDDTNILVSGRTLPEAVDKAYDSSSRICDWFNRNELALNSSKTNIMVFRTKNSRVTPTGTINLNGNEVKPVHDMRFLGIHIDEFLDWNSHVEKTGLRLSSIGYGIRVVSRHMDERTLKILYHANFESVLRYGIVFWGCSSSIQLLFIIQKRTIRSIRHMKFGATCRGVFRDMQIMTIYGLYIFECLMFFFRHQVEFSSNFGHGYNTRTTNFIYPSHRLTSTEKGTYYMCIKLYNKLPSTCRLSSLIKFKNAIKKLLIKLEPYSLRDFLDCNNLSEFV
ncbi:uncharacterized protein LOC123673565 isoform X2 [Harmonia axyridis]|uniref:uncharacterized protein LOC123673565 isoform X2 n=1 Tax=Harmonia axyridis TaxID=115357 RepID=UPI001E2750E6|nr:uncharacterized protein LOC123673565 isoform X2 [Harmonia axyridis]